ncbi:hypothetical protein [Streptomyces avicenniae]|uniref:hypothetical protein n=1 Tax=Streptomyces avicenniae TaxID=500153 RepID=UPI000699D51A|nr:hypothetical protein [Streptomyces avicenniae]
MPYHDRRTFPPPRGAAARGGLTLAAAGAALGLAVLYVPRTRTRQGIRRLAGLVDESWYWFHQGLLVWLDEDPAGAKQLYDRPPPGIRMVPEEELVRRIFADPDDEPHDGADSPAATR